MAHLFIALVSLIPWLFFGLQGPFSDAYRFLIGALAKFGLFSLDWYQLLYSYGTGMLLAPIFLVLPGGWPIWIGSIVLAVSSIYFSWRYWDLLSDLILSARIAWGATLLMAFHPLLHQMHFYWMTELTYGMALLCFLHWLARFLSHATPDFRSLLYASLWLCLGMLLRPQIMLVVPMGFAAIGWYCWRQRNPWRPVLLYSLVAFIGFPVLVTLPIRWLNHRQHGSWKMNVALGDNFGTYLQFGPGSYDPKNGPASAQLYAWSGQLMEEMSGARIAVLKLNAKRFANADFDKRYGRLRLSRDRVLNEPTELLAQHLLRLRYSGMFLSDHTNIPAVRWQKMYPRESDQFVYHETGKYTYRHWPEIFKNPAVANPRSPLTGLSPDTLEKLRSMSATVLSSVVIPYSAPKFIAYAFSHDWQQANQYPLLVLREAVAAAPRHYVRWVSRQMRWYLTAKSENPEEWQDTFWKDNQARKNEALRIPLTERTLEAPTRGGWIYQNPGLYRIYYLARTIYAMGMTGLKKIMTVLLFPMLWIVYRRGSALAQWFFPLAVAVHVSTAAALGILVGYAHRYNSPLDLFTLLYAAWWMEWLVQRLRQKTAVRGL